MDLAVILRTSTVLLAIAAVGGLVMAGMRFAGNRQPPAGLAMLHGFLAAAAVTLLLYAAPTIGLPGHGARRAPSISRCCWRRRGAQLEVSLETAASAQRTDRWACGRRRRRLRVAACSYVDYAYSVIGAAPTI